MNCEVSNFFNPKTPTRPANFVVVKYFLLGLLISNSIESILIIPKILDVLDTNDAQHTELHGLNGKIKALEAKETEEANKEMAKNAKKAAVEIEETFEREKPKEHLKSAEKGKEGKKEDHKKKHHHTLTRRAPKRSTDTNFVAVFMLFYGSVTLCLGVVGIFKEQQSLLMGLLGVTFLGVLILISAGFSLIMLLSVSKDCLIAAICFKYLDMIKKSDLLMPQEDPQAAVAGGDMAAQGPNPFGEYSAQPTQQQ